MVRRARGRAGLQRAPAGVWLALGGLVAAGSFLLAKDLETEHRITEDLWPDSALMQQLTFYEQRFVGIMPAEIVVEVDDRFGVEEAAELRRFCERIEAEPGVSRTLSIADLFADGVSPRVLAMLRVMQLLPSGLLGSDGRTARVLAFRGDLGTKAFRAFEQAVQRHGEGLERLRVRLAGVQLVGTAQVLSMTDDLRNSFLGSVVVIFLLVWLQCRRVPLAVTAMLACLVPMVAVVGAMVLMGVTLRPLTVISFCVALGLMIDDTIHLAARFREERLDGRAPDEAVQRTLATAGRPVVITTLVLLVGFVTILGSGFRGTHTFGLLVDLSLLGALASALVLLPALLRVLGRRVR